MSLPNAIPFLLMMKVCLGEDQVFAGVLQVEGEGPLMGQAGGRLPHPVHEVMKNSVLNKELTAV